MQKETFRVEPLTPREVNIINSLNIHTKAIKFGDKIDEIIGAIDTGVAIYTPVNAVKASKDLAISGAVVHGETVKVNYLYGSGEDVYEFLADQAQSKENENNIAVDITAFVSPASGALTLGEQPVSGDTLGLAGKNYIFVPDGTATADGEISIGTNLATAQAAIVAAINGTDGVNIKNPKIMALDFDANEAPVYAVVGGAAANSYATSADFTNGLANKFDSPSLSEGSDCSAANAITALLAAINALDTQGVLASDEEGDVLKITAKTPGVNGNSIMISETMLNGAFENNDTFLSGGVNGTVGTPQQIFVDDTYLYICTAENTITDSNWRRISLGSEF